MGVPTVVQWVKDPALLQAAALVADSAQIPCCWWLWLDCSCWTHSPGTSICHRCIKKKKRKKQRQFILNPSLFPSKKYLFFYFL